MTRISEIVAGVEYDWSVGSDPPPGKQGVFLYRHEWEAVRDAAVEWERLTLEPAPTGEPFVVDWNPTIVEVTERSWLPHWQTDDDQLRRVVAEDLEDIDADHPAAITIMPGSPIMLAARRWANQGHSGGSWSITANGETYGPVPWDSLTADVGRLPGRHRRRGRHLRRRR